MTGGWGGEQEVDPAERERVFRPLARRLIALTAAAATATGSTRAAAAAGGARVIGVGGGVAVGKSAVARALTAALEQDADGGAAVVVSTDGFLRPNAELERAGLSAARATRRATTWRRCGRC